MSLLRLLEFWEPWPNRANLNDSLVSISCALCVALLIQDTTTYSLLSLVPSHYSACMLILFDQLYISQLGLAPQDMLSLNFARKLSSGPTRYSYRIHSNVNRCEDPRTQMDQNSTCALFNPRPEVIPYVQLAVRNRRSPCIFMGIDPPRGGSNIFSTLRPRR